MGRPSPLPKKYTSAPDNLLAESTHAENICAIVGALTCASPTSLSAPTSITFALSITQEGMGRAPGVENTSNFFLVATTTHPPPMPAKGARRC